LGRSERATTKIRAKFIKSEKENFHLEKFIHSSAPLQPTREKLLGQVWPGSFSVQVLR